MFTATATSFRTTVTAVAASMLGTALIFATPQVAHAAPAAGFVKDVEMQLNADRFAPSSLTGVATIAVRVDAEGTVLSADVADSSGHSSLDRDALLSARSVAYPKGTGVRTVAVVMTYGNVAKPSAEQSARVVNRYVNAKGEALASQSPATPTG